MKTICRASRLAICLVIVLLLPARNTAGATTITFDELPTQPVDGLSLLGVTFHYESFILPPATFNSFLLGQGPSLVGNVFGNLGENTFGTLTVDFSTPVPHLTFDFALRNFFAGFTGPSFAPVALVQAELFDADLDNLGTIVSNVNVTEEQLRQDPLFFGFFSYTGTPVARASLLFDVSAPTPSAHLAAQFALDNLTFETTTVPEPSSLCLLATGIACLAVRRRRRTRM